MPAPASFSRLEIDQALLHLRQQLLNNLPQHGPYHSAFEGRGVIDEEVEELHEAIRKHRRPEVLAEALDVAATSLWLYMTTARELDQ